MLNELDKDTFNILMCKAYCPEACPRSMEEKVREQNIPSTQAFQETILERVDRLIDQGVYDAFPLSVITAFRRDIMVPMQQRINGTRVTTPMNAWHKKASLVSGRTSARSDIFYLKFPVMPRDIKDVTEEIELLQLSKQAYALHMFTAGRKATKSKINKLKRKKENDLRAKEKIQEERCNKDHRLFD